MRFDWQKSDLFFLKGKKKDFIEKNHIYFENFKKKSKKKKERERFSLRKIKYVFKS